VLNYKQLFYFWHVAKHGGITRAAEQLHLTPQTISGQLSELERSLDVELFQRSGRRLVLTSAGKLALSHAEEIFQIGTELEALMRGAREAGELLLKVGVSDAIPKSIAYHLLAPSYQLSEPVRMICNEGKLESLFADLAVHRLDLVIADCSLPSDIGVKGFSHLLGESVTSFYAKSDLAEHYQSDFPQSLHGAPILLPGKGSALRPALDRWLSSSGIQPIIKGEFDDAALMKAFGQEGVGIFPAPQVIGHETEHQHGVDEIGQVSQLSVRYYGISAERKLRHPAVQAISKSAKETLFNQ
tara:strand:- start:18015 stop:18911 length:897 start_codon:yes stop_codon:yes gene_type:complete